MRWVVRGAALLVALGLGPTAWGQVNTEKLRSWERPGLGGGVDFALNYRSGNVDLVQVTTGVQLRWARLAPATSSTAPGRLLDLVYFVGSQDLGIQPAGRFKNAGFGHLRWTRMWHRRVGTELFVQAQYNEFILLQQRYLGGLGARWEVLSGKAGEVVLGSAYILEFEDNAVPEDGPDVKEVLAHRWSSYLSVKAYLSDPAVSVVDTVYVQPRLTDLSDLRVLNEAELSVQVTGALALVAGVYLRYDSQPVSGVERLDVSTENKLRVTF